MPLVCREIFNEVCVLGNGDVVCSCIDSRGIKILGNVKHNSINKIFLGKQYRDLREQVLNSKDDTYCPSLTLNCGFKIVPAENLIRDDSAPIIDKIRMETFSRCNLKCPSCIVPDLMETDQHPRLGRLPMGKIREILIDTNNTLKTLFLYNYGEPFMDRRFLDILRMARQIVPHAHLYTHTNGTIIPDGWLETIVKEELLDGISFSIDGASQDTYEKYRIGGSFDTAFRNMTSINDYRTRFKKAKPDVEWQYILFEWNDSEEEVSRAQQLAEGHGLHIRWLLTYTDGKSRKFIPESEEWKALSGEKYYASELYANVINNRHEEIMRKYEGLLTIGDNAEFLFAAYEEVLGRKPDKEGLEFYLSTLRDRKTTRGGLIRALLNHQEMDRRIHEELREKYPELFAVAGDEEFVGRSYANILGREPDKEGLEFYLSTLKDRKTTREGLIRALLNRQETDRRIDEDLRGKYPELFAVAGDEEFVGRSYANILGREPDKEGLEFYLSTLRDRKRTREGLIRTLLNRQETDRRIDEDLRGKYPELFAVAGDEEFVGRAYGKILGREPDEEGLEFYLSTLRDRQTTREGLIRTLLNRQETDRRIHEELREKYSELFAVPGDEEFVGRAYGKILGREPDEEGLEFYLSTLRDRQTTREGLIRTLLNYQEADNKVHEELINNYRGIISISDNREFLTKAYEEILGRKPDEEGREYYLSNLTRHRITKEAIIKTLLKSRLQQL